MTRHQATAGSAEATPTGATAGGEPAGSNVAGLLLAGVAPPLPDGREAASVDLVVPPGVSLAVTGPSGVGKTTLLAVLAGLVAPARGSVELDGVAVRAGDREHARRTGYLQQGFGLVSTLTARENVLAVLLDRPDRRAGAAADTAQVLAALDLDELADLRVDRLSGGQQQRVALARALVVRPRLLLADEPTSELDAATRRQVLALLLDGTPDRVVVVATHDPEVARRCDEILVLGEADAAPRATARHRAV